MIFRQAQRELTPFATGLSKSIYGGIRAGSSGVLLGLALMSASVAAAPKGAMVETAAGEAAGMVTYPVFAGAAAGLAFAIAPVLGVGAAAFVGMVAAAYPSGWVVDNVTRQYRGFTRSMARLRRLEMGGHYRDTQTAQAYRMAAVRDMNSAFIPARRFLGQEALMLHR